MPVSVLAPTGARRKAALSFAQELLDWVYADFPDPRESRLEFWLLFTGLTRRQARTGGREAFDRMEEHSRSWDWPKIQLWMREAVEAQLGNLGKDVGPALPLAPRRLMTVLPDKGRPFVVWYPTLSADINPEATTAFLLDEVFTEISGSSVDAFGRCESCKRYLIRQRHGRQRYCSNRCSVRARRARDKEPARSRRIRRGRGAAKRKKR